MKCLGTYGSKGCFNTENVGHVCNLPPSENPVNQAGCKPAPRLGGLSKLPRVVVPNALTFIHGHVHNGLRGWTDHDVHEICLPSVLYNLDRGLEKKQAPGYNPLEFRPGYVSVTIGDGEMKLSYKPTGNQATVGKTVRFP